MSLRLAFMGTPDFAVPVLDALIKQGHDVVAVYSQPPRPAGRRGLELTPSPVHNRARDYGIPVFTPKSLKTAEEQARFSALELDAAVVVAYGLILPKPILQASRFGCFNAHASLLPRWRGAAPIQRAIMAGDAETGVMVMKMDEGLDTGPIALQKKIAIAPEMTAGMLHDKLAVMAAGLMVDAMKALQDGRLTLVDQPNDYAIYAEKVLKQEARIDWRQSAVHIQRQICGLSPVPGAWCEMQIAGKYERVKLLGARLVADVDKNCQQASPENLVVACGEGAIQLTRMQRAGSKPLDVRDFLRGAAITMIK